MRGLYCVYDKVSRGSSAQDGTLDFTTKKQFSFIFVNEKGLVLMS